jgi:hypothetical protein
MKKITVPFIIFAVLICMSSLNAQPQRLSSAALVSSSYNYPVDDSLLYDGVFSGSSPLIPNDDCPIKVNYASGTTNASKHVLLTVTTCGVTSSSEQIQNGPLQKDDKLLPGSEISTGSDGKAELQLGDGSVIRMGPNTTIKITQEHCVSTSIFTISGNIWLKVKKLLGGGKFYVEGRVAGGGVRGTEFTVEATENSAIFTVYEGSVEVTPKGSSGKYKEDLKDVEKLTQDFQSGKISMEEFGKKMEEYSKKIEESATNMNKPAMVEAGYMITITDKVKGPEPFEKSSSNWFDDANFK